LRSRRAQSHDFSVRATAGLGVAKNIAVVQLNLAGDAWIWRGDQFKNILAER
jgi:hypothetical protein